MTENAIIWPIWRLNMIFILWTNEDTRRTYKVFNIVKIFTWKDSVLKISSGLSFWVHLPDPQILRIRSCIFSLFLYQTLFSKRRLFVWKQRFFLASGNNIQNKNEKKKINPRGGFHIPQPSNAKAKRKINLS